MTMVSPASAALTTVAMMVGMMLPSLAPSLWRYHHHLRAMQTPRAIAPVTLFAAAYLAVWTAIALVLFALSATLPTFGPWSLGAVVLGAGAIQRSGWKAKQLRRCRETCVATAGWQGGCRLGVSCALSCAGPMAVLFVAGLMDARMMLLITTLITAERVVPGGVRIARLTGTAALLAGLFLCVGACFRIAIPVW